MNAQIQCSKIIPKTAQSNEYQMNDPYCLNGAAYIESEWLCNYCTTVMQ